MEHVDDKMASAAWRSERQLRVPSVSAVLPDGRLVEMVMQSGATALAVWDGLHAERVPEVSVGGDRRLVPYSPQNNLLAHGVVKLPSGAEEYGTESELVAAVRTFLHRYVDVSPLFESVAAYYVLLTWVHDAFNELPYLRVRGEPGSGKTRFLLTVGSVCYKPIFASGASTVSPLFRIMDAMGGTLVIDESDFRLSDEKAEVVKILNNGNVRGFPVLRTEQVGGSKEFNPRAYHVFGPKIIATRGFFDDRALESRFISEQMSIDPLREDIPISLPAEHEAEAARLRNQLLLYRFKSLLRLRAQGLRGKLDSTLSPRLRQVFAPLLALVEDAATRDAMLALARRYEADLTADRALELEAALLQVIADLVRETGRLPSLQDIAGHFSVRHGADHGELTVRRVGWMVRKRLGVQTTKSHGTYAIAPEAWAKLGALYARYGIETRAPSGIASPESPESPSADEARGSPGTAGTS